MHADENFALVWNWAFDLPEFEHVGRAVSVANQRFHAAFRLQPSSKQRSRTRGVTGDTVGVHMRFTSMRT
jgi:hypothetical protein